MIGPTALVDLALPVLCLDRGTPKITGPNWPAFAKGVGMIGRALVAYLWNGKGIGACM